MSDEANEGTGKGNQPKKATAAEERWARLTDKEKAMIEDTLTRHRATLEELAKR